MADEIAITVLGTVTNGSFKDRIDHGQQKFTQAAIGACSNVVNVGTSEEDVSVGDITTLGWMFARNLDATNYVTFGPKSSGSMVALGRLEPGEVIALRLEPGVTIRWIANTAACLVDLRIFQD